MIPAIALSILSVTWAAVGVVAIRDRERGWATVSFTLAAMLAAGAAIHAIGRF